MCCTTRVVESGLAPTDESSSPYLLMCLLTTNLPLTYHLLTTSR